MSKKRLLIGATGLVGQHVLEQLRAANEAPRVLARRRPDSAPPDEEWVCAADLNEADLASFSDIDTVICTLGTTQKTAGSKQAFAAVDRDLVLHLAQCAFEAGASHWLQVSALGADARSPVYYNRIKGETDATLAELGFDRVDILRPSLLLGERQEHRAGEAVAQKAMPLLNPLLRGPLRKYRPVQAAQVARLLCELLVQTQPGAYIHHLEP